MLIWNCPCFSLWGFTVDHFLEAFGRWLWGCLHEACFNPWKATGLFVHYTQVQGSCGMVPFTWFLPIVTCGKILSTKQSIMASACVPPGCHVKLRGAVAGGRGWWHKSAPTYLSLPLVAASVNEAFHIGKKIIVFRGYSSEKPVNVPVWVSLRSTTFLTHFWNILVGLSFH